MIIKTELKCLIVKTERIFSNTGLGVETGDGEPTGVLEDLEKEMLKSSETVLKLIEEAKGHIESVIIAPLPNFNEEDANYLINTLKECKLQIKFLENLVKGGK